MTDIAPRIDAKDMLKTIAEVSKREALRIGGVTEIDIAGLIVSVLSVHPDLLEPFMRDAAKVFKSDTMMHENGCLTVLLASGEIVTPQYLRALKKAALSALEVGWN